MSRGSTKPDKHALYEAAAQDPERMASLLRAMHGGSPVVLAEDFCGTGAVSRQWLRLDLRGSAVCTDIDEDCLARLPRSKRLRKLRQDLLKNKPLPRGADVVFVGNFSICEIHDRERLVAYLARSRGRLRRGGVFVCDLYGGPGAWKVCRTSCTIPLHKPAGARLRYTWHQRRADAISGMVENSMHFRVLRADGSQITMNDAFRYRWRLWSASELREAMLEAGFRGVEVYPTRPDAVDGEGYMYVNPIADGSDLGDNWVVLLCARR